MTKKDLGNNTLSVVDEVFLRIYCFPGFLDKHPALPIFIGGKRPDAMRYKVFSMNNLHSTSATWRQVTTEEGTRTVAISLESRAGLCAAMTVTWIKKSIASQGVGVLSDIEMGSHHWMAIVQAAYEKGSMPNTQGLSRVDKIFPLLVSQNLKPCECSRGTGFFPPEQVVNWAISKSGHSLYAFEKSGPGGHMSHMIGMRCEGRILQMFNPSEGLYQYSDVSSFKQHMRSYLVRDGSKFCGEWGLISVSSYL
ncbi:hypothetical protein [Endozoicomonas lisbonensis]|uniref:hypothetical protein n=1 Tax=Endozoicomonas lisbonensis TaxID=3120522 RepID=UPI00339AEDD7